MDFTELRTAVEEAELVDAHAHNLVAVDSSFPFIKAFSEADGAALSHAPHSLSFKKSLKEVAELYGCEKSLEAVQEHRRVAGVEAISSRCFEAARIAALLLDDGLKLDKMYGVDWHKCVAPVVGRILRIESLAEQILDEEFPGGSSWTLDGDLSIPEAIEAAKDIFSQNAVQFYKIDLAVRSSGSANSVSSNFVKVKSNDSENHVSFVRVFWADASGQQRCRYIKRDTIKKVSALCIAGVQCYCTKYVQEVRQKTIVAVIDEYEDLLS